MPRKKPVKSSASPRRRRQIHEAEVSRRLTEIIGTLREAGMYDLADDLIVVREHVAPTIGLKLEPAIDPDPLTPNLPFPEEPEPAVRKDA